MTTEFKDVSHLIPPEWWRCPTEGDFVYMLCLGEEPIYVGASGQFRSRLSDHRRRLRRDPDYVFDRVLIKPQANRYAALREEAQLIEALQPRHNTVGK